MEPLTITVAVVAGALGTAATAIITRAHWTAHTKRLTALGGRVGE